MWCHSGSSLKLQWVSLIDCVWTQHVGGGTSKPKPVSKQIQINKRYNHLILTRANRVSRWRNERSTQRNTFNLSLSADWLSAVAQICASLSRLDPHKLDDIYSNVSKRSLAALWAVHTVFGASCTDTARSLQRNNPAVPPRNFPLSADGYLTLLVFSFKTSLLRFPLCRFSLRPAPLCIYAWKPEAASFLWPLPPH